MEAVPAALKNLTVAGIVAHVTVVYTMAMPVTVEFQGAVAVRPVALLYPIMAALPAVIPLATLVVPASLTNSDMAEMPRNLFPLHSPPPPLWQQCLQPK